MVIPRYRYKKGADAERELAKMLKKRGFSVIRAAKSGGRISTPDVVGVKGGVVLAFECKNWNKKPRLKNQELKKLKDWCGQGGALGFLGWRFKGKWLFSNINELEKDTTENTLELSDLLYVLNL